VPATALGPGDESPTVGAAAQVDVRPVAKDEEIRKRIQGVLDATGWFTEPRVRVTSGVVFLEGRCRSEEVRTWAGDLARKTQDVVAVANEMTVVPASPWNFRPMWSSLGDLGSEFVRGLPAVLFGLFILLLSAGAGLVASRVARRMLRPRVSSALLRLVLARSAGVLVFLLGVYVILRVAGLTQLALTLVGGTGLIGLAVGIAFRNITENFLASIFLSIQKPFETGDLVEITGVVGYVQQLNVRTTILMTLDGTVTQIPNATVYRSNLRNFTTNHNRRESFIVGIGYDDAIPEAQEVARRVLIEHPAVLDDPEPSVLVEGLGQSTVDLRVYFWFDGREHSLLKVRSSVIRMIKRAFQEHGISMPDEAREVIFPQGVQVRMVESDASRGPAGTAGRRAPEAADASTSAEAGLYSEAGVLEDLARKARPLQDSKNLLRPDDGDREEKGAGKGKEGSLKSATQN
jgi:small-conductance mechanosensitive channel